MNMKETFRPLNCNVFVEVDMVEEITAGGLMLPTQSRDRSQHAATYGAIVAMAVDAFHEVVRDYGLEFRPKVGDRVCFAKFEGAILADSEPVIRILKDVDITGVEEIALNHDWQAASVKAVLTAGRAEVVS